MDRTFSRSGFVAFVAQGGGEVTRRRKCTGAAVNLVMPRYSNDEPCGYHGNLHASAHHGAAHTWATNRAGTMATCTATCDGLHGRQLPERDQRLLTPQQECGVLWRRSARTTKFSVSADAPPALHASAHHGAPALFPTGEPRRAHRDRADGAIYTPTTAPSIRPRRRHLHAHDGAIYTRTNSVHESPPGFSGGRVMVFDPPKALPDHRPATY